MPSARLQLTSQFESAHFLPHVPEGHRCKRLHGHTFRCDIELRGAIDAREGWVRDFSLIDHAVDEVIGQLDHRLLNDIEGLQNPTSEIIATWLFARLQKTLPGLLSITVWENARMRAQVTKEDFEQ